jgi:hypothetical protein
MTFGSKPSQTSADCKLKRVYPRLPPRVHSAVPKGLPGNGSGNPSLPEAPSEGVVCGAEWSTDGLHICVENQLNPEA